MNANVTSMGGRYAWTHNADATYTIHDVPILAEIAKGELGNPVDVGREWMERAVERARLVREPPQSFRAPLHFQHHFQGRETERAGFLMPSRVGQMELHGKMTWVLFAELESIPAEAFDRIKAGEYPYRSVELGPWEKALEDPRIVSLALLSDDAPFFEFPLLTLAEVGGVPTAGSPMRLAEAKHPLVGVCSYTDGTRRILLSFPGVHMAETKPEEKKPEEKEKEKVIAQEQHKCPKCGTVLTCAKCGGRTKMEQNPGGPASVPAEQPKPGPEVKTLPMSAEVVTQMAALQGEVAALKAQSAERAAAEGLVKMVAEAKSSLSASGYRIDIETEKAMTTVAQSGGKVALDAFAASYQRTTPKTPPRSFAEYERTTALQRQDDHKEVMTYAAKGPEALESARRLSLQYDQLAGRGIRASRESFIAVNMEYEARQAAAEAAESAAGR